MRGASVTPRPPVYQQSEKWDHNARMSTSIFSQINYFWMRRIIYNYHKTIKLIYLSHGNWIEQWMNGAFMGLMNIRDCHEYRAHFQITDSECHKNDEGTKKASIIFNWACYLKKEIFTIYTVTVKMQSGSSAPKCPSIVHTSEMIHSHSYSSKEV